MCPFGRCPTSPLLLPLRRRPVAGDPGLKVASIQRLRLWIQNLLKRYRAGFRVRLPRNARQTSLRRRCSGIAPALRGFPSVYCSLLRVPLRSSLCCFPRFLRERGQAVAVFLSFCERPHAWPLKMTGCHSLLNLLPEGRRKGATRSIGSLFVQGGLRIHGRCPLRGQP